MTDRRIFLGMPGYGRQTEAAGRAFWNATRERFIHRERSDSAEARGWNEYRKGSLLASNFNQLWCSALNIVHHGGRLDYFAMLHDDVGPLDCGPEKYWLDMLIDELEANDLDVLGVAVPIKDARGMTSLALQGNDNWIPKARLSMHDLFRLPTTFTSRDLDAPLLLNTGCWVAKWNQEWARKVHFTINDEIVFNTSSNRYQSLTEPEDWFFSRLCHELNLKLGATRKIPLMHRGEMEFTNTVPWGTNFFDVESCDKSPVPAIDPDGFRCPWDVPGWLHYDEAKELWRLANGKRVLEIGSYCGCSTICLAQSAKAVVAVDYFDGRGTGSPGDTLVAFKANVERYGVASKITTAHPQDDSLLDEPNQFDFAFVDGAHDYESVKRDIGRVLVVLRPGGLIAFHDYHSASDPGVTQAVDGLLSDGAELLSITNTLAVVRPPASIPLEV